MILLIHGHPSETSLSRALAASYARGAARAGATIEELDLTRLAFDPQLGPDLGKNQDLEPDLLHARRRIEAAGHVVWFFPTWWAGPPGVVKGFVDRTFLPGWAFRYRSSGNALPDALLRGRSARIVTTMDSPGFWYRLWHQSSIHGAFERAFLRYVGFSPVKTTVFYAVRTSTPKLRARWLDQVERLGLADAKRHLVRTRQSARGPDARPALAVGE